MKQQQDKQKADRAAKIAELKKQEAAAKTEEEKKTLADERAATRSKERAGHVRAFERIAGHERL